jgi:prephenate dehydratase
VCGEVYVYVQHCLLGRVSKSACQEDLGFQNGFSGNSPPTTSMPSPSKPRSRSSTELEHIKRVYSHPQAFGQSETFLSTYLKCAERHEVSSTSEAAKLVANDKSGEAAAISSKSAADLHGLTILGEGIQDVSDNTTRFLIICRGPTDRNKEMLMPEEFRVSTGLDSNWKSLVVFKISHKSKSALMKALLVFNDRGLSLTSIDKRPGRVRPWQYNVLAEFEGYKAFRDSDLLRLALEELETTTEGTRWLGSWIDRFRP